MGSWPGATCVSNGRSVSSVGPPVAPPHHRKIGLVLQSPGCHLSHLSLAQDCLLQPKAHFEKLRESPFVQTPVFGLTRGDLGADCSSSTCHLCIRYNLLPSSQFLYYRAGAIIDPIPQANCENYAYFSESGIQEEFSKCSPHTRDSSMETTA